MKEVSYIQRNPMAPKDAWDSLSIADKAAMMKVAVQNGITNLDDIRQKYNEFAEGGNIYDDGGYKPSEEIKKRISKWEGKAMTGAKDPLSGKFLKNNSFESEAAAFTHALPESIRDQVLSNPELADNLFSYSYNVGAPRFKQRVVKALEDYYTGKGTARKIADSMWASGDAKLRGLRNRRAEEKEGVINALRVDVPAVQEPLLPVSTAVVNPFIIPAKNTTFFPQVTPIGDNYVEVQEITPEQRRAEQVRNTFDVINSYNMMMDMLSVPNNPQPIYVPKNAPYVVRGLGGPIVEAAMNKYKKAFGGNLFDGTTEDSQQMQIGRLSPYGGTWLPEVIVKASEDPIVIMARQNPKYRSTLSKMYETTKETGEELLTKPQATRLLEVYNEAGRPKLYPLHSGEDRAYTTDTPLGKQKMFLSAEPNEGLNDLIAELAHPLQKKYGNNKSWKERLNPFYDEDDYRGKTRYDFPNKYEHETHEDFEPLLQWYIEDNGLLGQSYITKGELGNYDIIINPNFKQIMDSAKVYNKRKQDNNFNNFLDIKPRRNAKSHLKDVW